MKRFLSIILALSLLTGLAGCVADAPADPGNFYYRRVNPIYEGTDGIIAPEVRELEGLRGNMAAMLQAYLSGPVSSSLESPFPRATTLLDWSMERSELTITLSEDFAELTGIDLTIACACIARTFLELTDAVFVRIQANGATLNGSEYIVMSQSSLSLADDSVDQLHTDLTLYYTDSERRYLIGHNISVNLAAQSDVVSYLVNQLITPPAGLGLLSPLPAGTKLLNSQIADGVCTLDFSTEFENNAFSQSHAQRATLLSLVNTLTQLEGIEKVEFHIEGNLMARYQQLSISKELVFDDSIIGPVRTGVNEFDATLYVYNGSGLYLASVPTRIRQSAGISQAELIINALIHYENENGFFSTIPSNTVLNYLKIEDRLCTIDLSSEFLEDTDHLAQSVRSIVASVCTLDDVDMGQITIDGQSPDGEYADLFLPLVPSSDWYL